MLRTSSCLLLVLGGLLIVNRTYGKIVIEPNPNNDVGMMSSETKYFNCKNDQNSGHERLAWIDKNGREIVNDPTNRIFVTMKRSQMKLELKNPTKQDSGIYKCVSRDKKTNRETSSEYFKLSVYTPTTVSGAASYRKSEDSNVVMECNAISDREASVEFTWMFGNFDLSSDSKKYRITTRQESGAPSADQIKTVSRLEIPKVTKDHNGKYQCMVDTTNRHLSDEKDLEIDLNVQYKPQFDAKTPKYVWVSEEAVRQGSPVTVNVSCLVAANPRAKIQWSYLNGGAVISSPRPNQMVTAQIVDSENYSTLTLEFKNADDIVHPKPGSKIRYTCTASNELGNIRQTFEIKIGRIPEAPQVLNMDYKDGFVILKLNDTSSEPPIDSFRLEVGGHAHVFNRTISTNNKPWQEYSIEMPLSRGDHKVNIYSHNPVGWSRTPESAYFLNVINGSPKMSYLSVMFVMILSLFAVRY